MTTTSKSGRSYKEFQDSHSTATDRNMTGISKTDPKGDYWGDGIPLSTSEAHRAPSSDHDSEERALGGITKTVELHVTEK